MTVLKSILSHVNNPVSIIAFLLVGIAVITRFYALGNIPHGITWDEAAIGYNGYAVITTRRDEWLQRLPVSFQSFGDYKAPLAIYIVGVSSFLFDLTAFSVRLPFAVAGVLFIIFFSLLVRLLFSFSQIKNSLTLIALVFATFSPWHFHYSRVGFESGIALFFVTAALVFIYHSVDFIKKNNSSWLGRILLALGGISFIASLYTYHSAKIAVPIILVYLLISLRDFIWQNKVLVGIVLFICVALAFPLINDSLYGSGAQRASVLITSQGLPTDELVRTFFSNIFAHLSPDFLIYGKVDSLRHGIGSWGVLTPFTGILSIFGFAWLFVKAENAKNYKKIVWFGVTLIAAGIIPAALSSETVPHSNRALLALPGFLLLIILGISQLLRLLMVNHHSKKLFFRLAIGTVVMIEALFFIAVWQQYTTTFAKQSTEAFIEGYVEAFAIAEEYEKGKNGKSPVNKIIFASEYGQSYIYALFVKKSSPIYYRGGSLNNYLLVTKVDKSALQEENTLVIASPESELPVDSADYIIRGSDGSERFFVYYPNQQ